MSRDVFHGGSPRVLKNFQPDFLDSMPVTVQMGLKCWQHLAQFCGGSVRANQQAPLGTLNGSRLDGVSKWAWN
jgi:hypothetical protein